MLNSSDILKCRGSEGIPYLNENALLKSTNSVNYVRSSAPFDRNTAPCIQCPRCHGHTESSSTRLVRDSCGHVKCRECMTKESRGCEECIIAYSKQQHQQETLSMSGYFQPSVSSGTIRNFKEFSQMQVKNDADVRSDNDKELFVDPNQKNGFTHIKMNANESEYLARQSSSMRFSQMKEGNYDDQKSDRDQSVNESELFNAIPKSTDSLTTSLSASRNEFEELRQRKNNVMDWLRICSFDEIDDQLVYLKCHFDSHQWDNALPKEVKNREIINRGIQKSKNYFEKVENLKVETDEPNQEIVLESTPEHNSRNATTLMIGDEKHSRTDGKRDRTQVKYPINRKEAPLSGQQSKLQPQGKRPKRKRNSIDPENFDHIIKNTDLDPPEYLCSICNRQFKNRLNIRYHIPCADKSAGHQCQECSRIFKSSSHLTYHMRTAHGREKPYKCRFCEKAFAQSVKLKRHELTHTGERPFKCDTCQHTFTTKYNLKEHENIHKAEKPYICSSCGAGFADRNNLRRHEASHLNDKSNKANSSTTVTQSRGTKRKVQTSAKDNKNIINVCESQNDLASSVRRSKRRKEQVQDSLECDFCHGHLDNHIELIRHQQTFHRNEKSASVCDHCGISFSNKEMMYIHMQERHSMNFSRHESGNYDSLSTVIKKEDDFGYLNMATGINQDIASNGNLMNTWDHSSAINLHLPNQLYSGDLTSAIEALNQHQNQTELEPQDLCKVEKELTFPLDQMCRGYTSTAASEKNIFALQDHNPQQESQMYSNGDVMDTQSYRHSSHLNGHASNEELVASNVKCSSSSHNISDNQSIPFYQDDNFKVDARDVSSLKALLKKLNNSDIYKFINNLTSNDRRCLNSILNSDPDLRQRREAKERQKQQMRTNKHEMSSDVSTASKKEFLKRYRRQVLEEQGSSSSSSTTNQAANVGLLEQQLIDDITMENNRPEDIGTPHLSEDQFGCVLKDVHLILERQKFIYSNRKKQEAGSSSEMSAKRNADKEEEESRRLDIRPTGRGLRKIAVFDDNDEDGL